MGPDELLGSRLHHFHIGNVIIGTTTRLWMRIIFYLKIDDSFERN